MNRIAAGALAVAALAASAQLSQRPSAGDLIELDVVALDRHDLHSIDVKVARKGIHVRARQRR